MISDTDFFPPKKTRIDWIQDADYYLWAFMKNLSEELTHEEIVLLDEALKIINTKEKYK